MTKENLEEMTSIGVKRRTLNRLNELRKTTIDGMVMKLSHDQLIQRIIQSYMKDQASKK